MEIGNEREVQAQALLSERASLKERWDTEFAGAAHFVIDQLLAVEPGERGLVLLELKKTVEQFVKAGQRDAVAGTYEHFDFSEDLFREIVYRSISRIERSGVLEHEQLVTEYKKLDSELSFPKIEEDLIFALNNNQEHVNKDVYLREVDKICNFIAQADVTNSKDRALVQRAIYWVIQGANRGFRIDEKLKLRIMQDVILNLVQRVRLVKSEAEAPRKGSLQDWTEIIKKKYLPQLNQTKVDLYVTANKLEKLRK